MIYDALIIGAGPAGITASILLKEKGYKVAVLEFYMPGGKVNIAPRVDNYPGKEKISGPDLAMDFFMRMNNAGIEYIATKVNSVTKKDDLFLLDTTSGELTSKIVIVASGTDEKKLGFDNEKDVFGHGLSYCAICDGHFYQGKVTGVVGEDRYALAEAIYLAKLSATVHFITSFDHVVGVQKLIDELASYPNVIYHFNSKVTELRGNPLSSIIINNKEEVAMEGLFPLLGYLPNTSFVPTTVLNEDCFIIVDKNYETSIKGLFAIGDVIERELKQIYLAEIDARKVVDYIVNNYGI